MPLDEKFLRDRLDLRARRARDRSHVPDDRRRVRELGADRHPSDQALFTDQSNQTIIGLGIIDNMLT